MSKLIVVIGLTGQQGGSVAEVMHREAGWKVRGITRDASKASSWSAKGIEVVEANLNDEASLVKAFKGAYAIFGVTDFWGPVFNPASKEKLKPGQTINQYAYDDEKQLGINIVNAAAKTEGLQRFVLSSACNANYWTKGRLTHVYHFDSKAAAVEYCEKEVPELAKKMSVLQIGCYMSNWGAAFHPKKQSDGTYRFANVGGGDTPIPQFFTSKDTGYATRALLQVEPGKNVLAAGSNIGWKECLRILCKSYNVPYGGYDAIPLDTYIKEFPMGPDLGQEFGEMFELMDNPGYDGGDPSVVQLSDLGVDCPVTSFEEWSKQADLAKIFGEQ